MMSIFNLKNWCWLLLISLSTSPCVPTFLCGQVTSVIQINQIRSALSSILIHIFGLGIYFISVMIQPNCECWKWMGLLLFYHPGPICQQSDQIILSNPLIIQKSKQQDRVTSSAFSTGLSHLNRRLVQILLDFLI